jgi:hypothetical protein
MSVAHKLHKDFIGGVLIFVTGLVVAFHSTSYHVGTLRQMGPGYFPLSLGVILSVVGGAIAVKGCLSEVHRVRDSRSPEWKAWALICLGIILFVILARYLGLVVATFAIVFVSALGDRTTSWKEAGVLALAMVVVSVVVFWWALQIQLPLFSWGGE